MASNDSFYSDRRTCSPFTRSDSICTPSGQREQFNILTAYIDGNNVYGSDEKRAKGLRTMTNGLLKTHRLGPTLPTASVAGLAQGITDLGEELVAGDIRATEQPGLASLHSLFLNEHNRIAREIKLLNSSLSDEDIYQLTRTAVIAQLQNIVYNEFLPLVLGPQQMQKHNLVLPEPSATASVLTTSTVYNSSIDTTISNEFATFAFRFGHSLIPNFFKTSKMPESEVASLCPLKDNFFHFEEFVVGKDFRGEAWKNLIVGISQQRSKSFGPRISEHVSNFLFCGSRDQCSLEAGFGESLPARNIQRGRDHGLPGWSKYRQFCGLSVPSSWSDKPSDISQTNWNNLQSVYTNVADIDPWTGAFSESSVEGGIVGATIACILGEQFTKLKDGDRFFFTHEKGGSQGEQGLEASVKDMFLRRRLSDIMCDNIQLEMLSRDVFQANSVKMNCTDRNILDTEYLAIREKFIETTAAPTTPIPTVPTVPTVPTTPSISPNDRGKINRKNRYIYKCLHINFRFDPHRRIWC